MFMIDSTIIANPRAADLRAGLARRCVGRCRWPRATDAKAGDSGARRTAGSSQIPGKVTLAMSSRRPLQGREELGATPLHVGEVGLPLGPARALLARYLRLALS